MGLLQYCLNLPVMPPDYGTDCDYNQEKFTRKVNLSLLDEETDTQQDWEHFLNSASKVDRLILWDDRKKSENKIYSGYLQATRQAYIWHLKKPKSIVFFGVKNK